MDTFPIRPAYFEADTEGMSDSDMKRIKMDIARLIDNPQVASFGLRGGWLAIDDDTVYYYGIGVTRHIGDSTEYLWSDYSKEDWKEALKRL